MSDYQDTLLREVDMSGLDTELAVAKLIYPDAHTDGINVYRCNNAPKMSDPLFDKHSPATAIALMEKLGIESGEDIGNVYYAGRSSTKGGNPHTTWAKTIPEAVYNCAAKIVEKSDAT